MHYLELGLKHSLELISWISKKILNLSADSVLARHGNLCILMISHIIWLVILLSFKKLSFTSKYGTAWVRKVSSPLHLNLFSFVLFVISIISLLGVFNFPLILYNCEVRLSTWFCILDHSLVLLILWLLFLVHNI